MVKKHGQQGGLHPANCNCKGPGCLSNPDYLKRKLAELKAAGKPIPPTWPKKYRELAVVDGAGKPVWEVKDGQVPSMAEQVEGVLKGARKPLPMPSEVKQQTIVTEQVPLQVDIPWDMLASVENDRLPPDAPPSAKVDASQEKKNILNDYFHKAFPDIMVSPKVAFAVALGFWQLPAALFWLPRWLKGKFKNFKWPWAKKDEKKPDEPKPPEVPK